MNISALRNFSEDENNFIDECKVAGSIDIERLCKLNTHRDILSLEKADSVILSKDIEIARKGIRFCTRIAFRLGDLLQKVGSSVYIISNMYLFDYIEDIHKAVKHDNVIFGSSHYKIRLSKPTAIPTTDMWIFYEFNEEDFNLDTLLVGCIFGNALRKVYNDTLVSYTRDFCVKYNYPHILTPYIASNIFTNIQINISKDYTPSETEHKYLLKHLPFFRI